MKVYLAGKIRKRCWRHEVVKGLDRVDGNYGQWPVLTDSIMGVWDYVGPYFTPLGEDPPQSRDGQTTVLHTLGDNNCGHGTCELIIRDYCLDAIRQADIVFAWIDAPDCYGTLIEIGFAYALGKLVFVAHPPAIDWREFWLPIACDNLPDRLRDRDDDWWVPGELPSCFPSPSVALTYLRGVLDGIGQEACNAILARSVVGAPTSS